MAGDNFTKLCLSIFCFEQKTWNGYQIAKLVERILNIKIDHIALFFSSQLAADVFFLLLGKLTRESSVMQLLLHFQGFRIFFLQVRNMTDWLILTCYFTGWSSIVWSTKFGLIIIIKSHRFCMRSSQALAWLPSCSWLCFDKTWDYLTR